MKTALIKGLLSPHKVPSPNAPLRLQEQVVAVGGGKVDAGCGLDLFGAELGGLVNKGQIKTLGAAQHGVCGGFAGAPRPGFAGHGSIRGAGG